MQNILISTGDIDMLDFVLEGIKALVALLLLISVIIAGKRYPQLAKKSWGLVVSGFALIFVGFVFDWTDEFINYELSTLADTIESMIEEIGLIGGLILVTIGFNRWFAFVALFLGLKRRR